MKTLAAASAVAALAPRTMAQAAGGPSPGKSRELKTDILIVGASLGGVAAALAALRMGRTVILTEETRWIGGQATTQGVPLDEHPWIEEFGCTQRYRDFRSGVRELYRRNYPLIPQARADRLLNPGAGWVSAMGFEPRAGMAVLYEMLQPHLSSGHLTLLLRHRPVSVTMDGDYCRAVTLQDDETGAQRTIAATITLDATELGELLELGKVEHAVGAESKAQTGEPNALDGEPDPQDQMGFTHVFALDYLPGEEHVIEPPRDYAFWRSRVNPQTGKSALTVADLFGLEHDFFGRAPQPGHYVCSPWNFRRMLCRDNFAKGAFPSDLTTAVWGQNEYRTGVLLGVTPEERARHLAAARQQSLSVIYWLQTEAPNGLEKRTGFPGLRPRGDFFGTDDGLAQYPYIRESRRIKAEFTILEQHFRTDLEATKAGPMKYPDSVGLSGYRIDIHKPAKQGKGSMTESLHGKHWCQQLPLGALIPQRVENLLPACKNLGVTAVTNGSFRVHPGEWNIGESAGALAAYCVAHQLQPRQVRNTSAHLADFQREIVRQGVELDWPRPLTSRSYFSHHDLEVKDRDTFYFGEAARL